MNIASLSIKHKKTRQGRQNWTTPVEFFDVGYVTNLFYVGDEAFLVA